MSEIQFIYCPVQHIKNPPSPQIAYTLSTATRTLHPFAHAEQVLRAASSLDALEAEISRAEAVADEIAQLKAAIEDLTSRADKKRKEIKWMEDSAGYRSEIQVGRKIFSTLKR